MCGASYQLASLLFIQGEYMPRTVTITVRITEAEREALAAIAETIGYGATVAGVVHQAIKNIIEKCRPEPGQ